MSKNILKYNKTFSFELDNKTKQTLKSKLTSKITHTNSDYLLTDRPDFDEPNTEPHIELNINDSRNEINPFKPKITQQTSNEHLAGSYETLSTQNNIKKYPFYIVILFRR